MAACKAKPPVKGKAGATDKSKSDADDKKKKGGFPFKGKK